MHESASPDFLREEILSALRAGCVHPCLLYSGLRQASLWAALHHSLSPAQIDESCLAIYGSAYSTAAAQLRGNVAHLVSLACGDGAKDVGCLHAIRKTSRAALYTPVDISLDLALAAARRAGRSVPGLQASPLLCNLPRCSVLPAILKGIDPAGAERILLFLGTIHNFWPPDILRSILYPLRAQDQLLISANLAPEDDPALSSILPQYDNEMTRRWLWGGLSELGLGPQDGELRFSIAPSPDPTLRRIEATFLLCGSRVVQIYGQEHRLASGESLSVFISHRFQPRHIQSFLEEAGLVVIQTWIASASHEGLFLCKRSPGGSP